MVSLLLLLACADDECPLAYVDVDGDGHGNPASESRSCEPELVAVGDDCDDSNAAIHPGAEEVCDEVDSNCADGIEDEDATIFYVDSDDDTYGSDALKIWACSVPPGYVSNADDCDDTTASIYPGGIELCDGVDNDCDGTTDVDALDAPGWYVDVDNDGYGVEGEVVRACEEPDFYADNDDDCDDSYARTYPGAEEYCGDGVVNDCNGNAESAQAACTTGLDLDNAIWEYSDNSENLGTALALADLDHDGTDDLIAGTPSNDYQGGAVVFFGPLTTDIDGGTRIEGSVDGGAAGQSLASGDVDGDGFGDLLIGEAGALYVVTEVTRDVSLADSEIALIGSGAYLEASELGHSVAAGDHDADGIVEVAVSAPRYAADGDYPGAVLLFSAGLQADMDPSDAVLTVNGVSGAGHLGEALLLPGDVDGDGVPELVMGAPRTAQGANGGGFVAMLPMDGSGTTLASSGVVWHGDAASDHAGSALASADFDSDGYADLVIAADMARSWSGVVYVIHGASGLAGGDLDGAADLRIDGEGSGDRLGRRVEILPDASGDGVDELVVSATGVDGSEGASAGAVYIITLASLSGSLDIDDVADVVIEGNGRNVYAGVPLGLEDRTGDGNGDLLIATPYASSPDVYLMQGITVTY